MRSCPRQAKKDSPECFLLALLPLKRIEDAKPNALNGETLGIAELLCELYPDHREH